MKKKKVIFRDAQIIDFCVTTRDTNEIHNPEFMKALGKRVIVPGMLALSSTINLSAEFLKNGGNSILIYFNSLLSSGDFVTLGNTVNPDDPHELRLSAINHKDTLSTNEEYSRIFRRSGDFNLIYPGIRRSLSIEPSMVSRFSGLTMGTDTDICRFLFAVAYTSQALLKSIVEPETEVEREIGRVISRANQVSPFYHSLEIQIPAPFPQFDPQGELDYFIHFTREKPGKLYTAHVRCEHLGRLIFHSRYKMIGIPDRMIYRMAKDISQPRHTVR